MKKLLLLSISAMMSLGAMAQTLTQDWKSTSVSFSSESNVRWGSGFGGKVYVNDRGTKTLYSFSKDATSGNVVQEVVLSEGTSPNAFGIGFDGSGNALMYKTFGANGVMQGGFILIKAGTNETKEIALTSADLEAIGTTSMRMDYMGRGVGNIFSEDGGVFFLLGVNQNKVVKLVIVNGEIDKTKTKVIETNVEALLTSGVNNAIVVPMTDDVNSDLIALRYSNTQTYYNNGTEFKAWEKKSNNTAGLDYFVLNDVPFTVEPAGTNKADGFVIVNRYTNEVVATQNPTIENPTNTGVSNSLSVEKVNNTTVRIYQYFPNKFAAQYTFVIPADYTTAIESVEVAAGAVEYYNLQGVKVANPENGLFIKKQGNKVSKVIL